MKSLFTSLWKRLLCCRSFRQGSHGNYLRSSKLFGCHGDKLLYLVVIYVMLLLYGNQSYLEKVRDMRIYASNLMRNFLYENDYRSEDILTLFTSVKEEMYWSPDSYNRSWIHHNMLMNWAEVQRQNQGVHLILFTENVNGKLANKAQKLGWRVEPIPSANEFGVPYIKALYKRASILYKTTFYGYSNGDILFGLNLLETLTTVRRHLLQLNRAMIIGKRTNLAIAKKVLYKPGEVESIEGQLYATDTLEYFIIAHNNFPWKQVPELVIGRIGYDTFLAGLAIRARVPLIDATNTLRAVHQTGKDGNKAGLHVRFINDRDFNVQAIEKSNICEGNHSCIGTTIQASYQTFFTQENYIKLRDMKSLKILETKLPKKRSVWQAVKKNAKSVVGRS